MTVFNKLVIAGSDHEKLKEHLFPEDGLEAVAILLCNGLPDAHVSKLIVEEIILVPHGACSLRSNDHISWPGSALEESIDKAELESLSIILLHSHPAGTLDFSAQDDASDSQVIPSVFAGIYPKSGVHGSAIIVSNGDIKVRLYSEDLIVHYLETVMIVGDDISVIDLDDKGCVSSRPMCFTSAMSIDLARFSACVVGISGTGSIIAESLARLGIGELILVDFDRVELKNLNRILNSTLDDSLNNRLKTEMMGEAISKYRSDIKVTTVSLSIGDRQAVLASSGADFLFSCVDSVEARQFCDSMSRAFLMPLFDIGVTIPTNTNDMGEHKVFGAYGRVDYIQPGGSTLFDREVYTAESLRGEYLRRTSPKDYEVELEAGYLKGVPEEAPSVISLNMEVASKCMNEFIARLYPFRHELNRCYARTLFCNAASEIDYVSEDSFESCNSFEVGRGLKEPLLGLPSLSLTSKAA